VHQITYSIRRIAPAELPTVRDLDTDVERPMSAAELLNLDIVPLGDDLYSCADQSRRDPDTLEWSVVGVQSPGAAIAEGSLRERHARLPADVAPHVFRAQVIRSQDPATPVRETVESNLAEVGLALAEFVGLVDGAPLVDLSQPDAVLEEAQRLTEIHGNGIERAVVSMAMVDPGDVVEEDRIIPHRWSGESPH
jgi:hypothetical protein